MSAEGGKRTWTGRRTYENESGRDEGGVSKGERDVNSGHFLPFTKEQKYVMSDEITC